MTYTREEYELLNGPQTAALMQGVNDQAANTALTSLTNQAALMQALNQQTAEIAAAIVAAKAGG